MTDPRRDRPGVRVLVVEDDPIALDAHVAYVERVPGFTVAARAGTGTEALRQVAGDGIDLVLLDMNLPDVHGMDVCRAVRARGRPVDVIAVTSARDLDLVRTAVSLGVVQYLLKPFTFSALRDRLERYAAARAELLGDRQVSGQQEVDRLLGTAPAGGDRLPKGMSADSLEAVIAVLQVAALSAGEAGEKVGMSRVSARRYLEYLHERGLAERSTRYGTPGRPEIEYVWRG